MEAGLDAGLPESFKQRLVRRREAVPGIIVVMEDVSHLPDADFLAGQGPYDLDEAYRN